jgi:hypothetical protein
VSRGEYVSVRVCERVAVLVLVLVLVLVWFETVVVVMD